MSARNATEPADARFGFIEQDPGMLLHDVVSDFLNVADFVATHRDNPVADSSVLLDALNVAACGIAENMRRRAELWTMDNQLSLDSVRGFVEDVEWGEFKGGIGSARLIIRTPVVSPNDDAAVGAFAKQLQEGGIPVEAFVRLARAKEKGGAE